MTTAFLQREPDPADRERWRDELAAIPPAARCGERLVLFLFRVGSERFGIESAYLELAAPLPGLHSMPHRREALAGVINVRGSVTLCFSLANILGCAAGPAPVRPMMLVLTHRTWRVACRVDACEGMAEFERSALLPVPATLLAASRTHLKGLFGAGDEPDVAWLDADSRFNAFNAAAG